MKNLIAFILFPFLIFPFETKANENFSVEIEALTLVMEQYKKDSESNVDFDSNEKKRNGNKIKPINFFISIKCVYFFYNVYCLLKEGALAL